MINNNNNNDNNPIKREMEWDFQKPTTHGKTFPKKWLFIHPHPLNINQYF